MGVLLRAFILTYHNRIIILFRYSREVELLFWHVNVVCGYLLYKDNCIFKCLRWAHHFVQNNLRE